MERNVRWTFRSVLSTDIRVGRISELSGTGVGSAAVRGSTLAPRVRKTISRKGSASTGLVLLAVVFSVAVIAIQKGNITLFSFAAFLALPVNLTFSRLLRDARAIFLVWGLAIFLSVAVRPERLRASLAEALFPGSLFCASLLFVGICARLGDRVRSSLMVVCAIGTGIAIASLVFDGASADLTLFKTGFGVGFPMAALAASGLIGLSRTTVAFGSFVGGVIAIAADNRALGGILIVTSFLLILFRSRSSGRIARLRLLRITTVAVVGGLVASQLYLYLAKANLLSASASQRYQSQSSSTGGLILGARHELLVSIPVIYQHTLLGIGPKAQLSVSDVDDVSTLASRFNISLTPHEFDRLTLHGANAHSLLLQSWVDLGVVGAVPWLLLLALLWRAAARALSSPLPWSAVMTYFAVSTTWDVLFSPLTARFDASFAAKIGLACLILSANKDASVKGPIRTNAEGSSS